MAKRDIEAIRERMTEGELQTFELAVDGCFLDDAEVILKDCEARIAKEDESMGKAVQRELPILFNTEMVRAILDGRKTTTRRLIRPRYKEDESGFKVMTNMGTGERRVEKADGEEMSFDPPRYINPPYQPGDILYVRETWFYEHHMEDRAAGEPDLPNGEYSSRYIYRADDPDYPVNVGVCAYGWKPSILMPKVAARIWMKVTDVRVERLQDMNLDDFLTEGAVIRPEAFDDPENAYRQARSEFIAIWDSTIKKSDRDIYGWEANPWVWVIGFERCEKPGRAESEGKVCRI